MTTVPQNIKGDLTNLVFGAIKASDEMLDFCLDIASPKIRWMMLQQANAVRPLRGFRLTQDVVDKPQVRKFLSDTFHKEAWLQHSYANAFLCLIPIQQSIRFLRLLGDDWMAHNWRRFFGFLVDPRIVALTMLLGFKEGVMFRLGLRLARCHKFWTIPHNLDNSDYGILMDAMIQPFAGNDRKTLLEKSNKKLLNAVLFEEPAQKIGDMADRLKEAERNSRDDRERLTASEKDADVLSRELEKARAEAAAETASLRARLAEREERIVRLEEENGWLKAHGGDVDRKWVEEVHDSHADVAEILQNAERILREQEERNLRYGTLLTLRKDAEQLQDMEGRLREAMRISHSLHPQMNEMYRQVQAAVRRIGERLAGTPEGEGMVEESPVVLQMRTAIRSVSPDSGFRSKLDGILTFLHDKCMETLLTSTEISSLCDECAKRAEFLQKATDTYAAARKSVPEIWNLDGRRDEMSKTVIVLDAYNVMLRSSEWQNRINEGKSSFQELRNEFIRQCRSLGSLFKEVWLVFDGNDEENDKECREGNVCVAYARRQQDEHNADLFIRDLFNGKLADKNAWLVTDDYGLRYSIEDKVGAFIPGYALLKIPKTLF